MPAKARPECGSVDSGLAPSKRTWNGLPMLWFCLLLVVVYFVTARTFIV